MAPNCLRERACRHQDSESLVVDQMILLQKKRA
jgi:hypothetical protein